jgi:hypothetical protein
MNSLIERRIRFLLDAAKYEVKKDQVITYAMRVLSNHATIGKDAGSAEIKKINKIISEEAQNLLYSSDLETFCKSTINEHPKPIQSTWEWIRDNVETLTIEKVWKEFLRNPMVTVTKDEDSLIKASGQNSVGNIESRYTALGIKKVTLTETPYEYHKRLKGII